MKKMLMALAMSAVVALSAGMLVGCGGGDEDVIREALTQELDAIKNQDAVAIAEMVASADASSFEQMGISAEEFLTSYLDGFDYVIGDIVVEGEVATAEVTMSCKSFNDFMSAMDDIVVELESDPVIQTMTSESELYAYVGGLMMSALDSLGVAQCEPVIVTYNLIDGEWTPTASSEDLIANALMSN